MNKIILKNKLNIINFIIKNKSYFNDEIIKYADEIKNKYFLPLLKSYNSEYILLNELKTYIKKEYSDIIKVNNSVTNHDLIYFYFLEHIFTFLYKKDIDDIFLHIEKNNYYYTKPYKSIIINIINDFEECGDLYSKIYNLLFQRHKTILLINNKKYDYLNKIEKVIDNNIYTYVLNSCIFDLDNEHILEIKQNKKDIGYKVIITNLNTNKKEKTIFKDILPKLTTIIENFYK